MADKPRIRVKAGSVAINGEILPPSNAPARIRAFDAGKNARRLRGMPRSSQPINHQLKAYGPTILARSRYLAANNPYAAAAKQAFISALVGDGIKPSSLVEDDNLKNEIQTAWLDWTDVADADDVTDFYGLQSIVASEMFEAGECFVRFLPRDTNDDGLAPIRLQVLPAEMLPMEDRDLGGGRKIELGIEFDQNGKRLAYHFLKRRGESEIVTVPASEVMHLFKPVMAGQFRGIPHTLSAIVKLAMMDQYDDAELERKKIAALFGGFITRPAIEEGDHPLEEGISASEVGGAVALEPGAMVDLAEGEDVKFAEPADVGGSYEMFQYRTLLAIAAGFGVPYAAMTGDLRQTSYGSIRAGLVEFRRRITAMQHHVMVYQFCRRVWQRWMDEGVISGVLPISPQAYSSERRNFVRAKWIPPRWEWIDPEKDRQAELLAVRAGFKSLSDVIEEEGYDPAETLARIKSDNDMIDEMNLVFDSDPRKLSRAGLTQARMEGAQLPNMTPQEGTPAPTPDDEDETDGA